MDAVRSLPDIDLSRLADETGRLIVLRGGCHCRNGQPCHACMDQVTLLEAAELGLGSFGAATGDVCFGDIRRLTPEKDRL